MNLFRIACCTFLLLAAALTATAQHAFTDAEGEAIQSFIDTRVGNTNSAIVVGLVDAEGSKVFSAGKLDNGTANAVDGDTVFFIGSVSKTFTALLLLEMVERGEMKLDDPVAKYLPASVKVPSYGGKEITLFHLATQSSGLPFNADNMTGANEEDQYETYTVDKMYAFLSDHKLNHDPGTEFDYSNVGMSLLGHAMARRANAAFESLVIDRICRPLNMDSTCIQPTPEQQPRLAMGHDDKGKASPPWQLDAYEPAGSVHSTANDLLKYAAAQAGLMQSKLTPLIEQSHIIRFVDTHDLPGEATPIVFGRTAMPWVDRGAVQPPGMELLAHAGGAGSYHAWVGFDLKQRRGVVVLTTANNLSVESVGWTILQRLPLTNGSTVDFAREMVGIGAALEIEPQTSRLRITKVFAGSPASQAGLSAGLVIQKIGHVSTANRSLVECVELIRGPAGSKVRLEVLDTEGNETKAVEVTRQKFAITNS